MRAPPVVSSLVVVVAVTALALAGPQKAAPPPPQDPHTMAGWDLYNQYCLACHGYAGDGRGPAAPFNWAQPRSFVAGDYKWRSTPAGQPPLDDDLRLTIQQGVPGTSMPPFVSVLSATDLDRMVAIVKAFAPTAFAKPGTALQLGAAPAFAPDRGRTLWAKSGCAACHGDDGKGDGPAMKVHPYDLTALPLRRPRTADDQDARRRAAALSIATGIAGTAMPSYTGGTPEADIWALADFVVAQGAHAARTSRAYDDQQIEDDAAARLAVGGWAGSGDPDEAVVWAGPIPPQGTPPDSLAPAEASLHARQCARCHAKQYREWNASLHSSAASPGLRAQVDVMTTEVSASCRRCHTPLAEQQPSQPGFDADLRDEGVQCAGCHVRDWIRRGPARIAASLVPLPAYPLVTLAIYERADFCMPCHQLPPRTAVNGRPLLDTYKEWLEGPYMRRGVQCQSCHMPNREHTFLGIHDREIFKQGIHLATDATRGGDGAVTVTASLTNVGAGHMLPTTPTPAAWIAIELLDGRGQAIDGATAELRIGRDIYWDGQWHERADTRIPPGETRSLTHSWKLAQARSAHVTVEVHPDDYYEHFYANRLAGRLGAAERAQYEAALERARASYYVAEDRIVQLP
nr:c-type cytochrome [Kofleriaceae bacterium]